MTLRERLQAMIDLFPPGAHVVLTTDAVRVWLEEDEASTGQPAEAPAQSVTRDLTVHEVAGVFERGDSTVRTWITDGQFPNAYRLQGREWRVPIADVEAMQRRQSAEQRAQLQPSSAPARFRGSSNLSSWRDVKRPRR